MQALWSRAGQAQRCGCKACSKAAGGMIRQSATRMTPRKPTFSEIFTACYTGIMASAAMIDAKVKDERRLELDRQLEQAKKDLEILKQRRPPRQLDADEPAPGSTENRYKGATWDHRPQSAEIAECLDSLRDLHGRSKPLRRSVEVRAWLENNGAGTSKKSLEMLAPTDYAAWDERLMSEEWNPTPNMAHRMPKSLAQLEAAEVHMMEMIDRLLRDSFRIWPIPVWHDIRNLVNHLRRKNLPQYNRRTDMAKIAECSALLNHTLRAIFSNHDYKRHEKLKKIIHNLLASPQPPTIHTYNLLILGLDRLGLYGLAQGVVGSLFTSRREPMRSTLVCLLNHFKDKGDDDGFFGLLQRLTGKDPRGTSRVQPIEGVLSRAGVFRWTASKNVAIHEEVVVERAWLDLDIFTAIVEGLLKLGYVRHAAAVFAVGLKNGIKFTMRTMSQLLEHTVHTLDETAASQVLHIIEMRPRHMQAQVSQSEDQKYLARRVQNLLDICHSRKKLLSVIPWSNVPKSSLPSREQSRGVRIASLMHKVTRSAAKIKYFKREIKNFRQMKRKLYPARISCENTDRVRRQAKLSHQVFIEDGLLEETALNCTANEGECRPNKSAETAGRSLEVNAYEKGLATAQDTPRYFEMQPRTRATATAAASSL